LVFFIAKGGNRVYNKTMVDYLADGKIFSVSDYVKLLDEGLRAFRARIVGEVSEVNPGPTGHIYFTLKDEKDEYLIRCVIWRGRYNLYGVRLREGMKIIASGEPSLHPKYGFKFIAEVIEPAGEGILKKEYEALKKKLEAEGIFSPERKRPIPEFPRRVGLITSWNGAAINDFLNNLGKYGYQIKFIDSRVEGQAAVPELIGAIDYFIERGQIDVLVLIRGGGSLESLQAFNNETLVRRIASCPFPVICGIGHDKDVPLASLAADRAVSTPTAVTSVLNESWDRALADLSMFEKEIIYRYQEMLRKAEFSLEDFSNKLSGQFGVFFQNLEKLSTQLKDRLAEIDYSIRNIKRSFVVNKDLLLRGFKKWTDNTGIFLEGVEKQLKIFNPIYQLRFGYSLVYSRKKLVRSTKDVEVGEPLDIRVSDGKINSEVKGKTNYGKRGI